MPGVFEDSEAGRKAKASIERSMGVPKPAPKDEEEEDAVSAAQKAGFNPDAARALYRKNKAKPSPSPSSLHTGFNSVNSPQSYESDQAIPTERE